MKVQVAVPQQPELTYDTTGYVHPTCWARLTKRGDMVDALRAEARVLLAKDTCEPNKS